MAKNKLIQKHNIEDFATFCIEGDIDSVNEYIKSGYIDDLTYDEGYFGVIAATKGHVDILKTLYKAEQKIQTYNNDFLVAAARSGQQECTKYLIYEAKVNPSELIMNSTSYNNYSTIKAIFDTYFASHSSLDSERHDDNSSINTPFAGDSSKVNDDSDGITS